jgi:hypothetical protein
MSTSATACGSAQRLRRRGEGGAAVTSAWGGLWNLLGRRQQIYSLSVAFDLSEHEPVVVPPKEVPEGAL